MRIAVCDDNKDFLARFCCQIKECSEEAVRVYRYTNGFDLLSDWHSGILFDLVFLDIEMSGLNGLEIAKEIRQFSEDVLIVIVTNHGGYALESFQHEPFHFLVKPVSQYQLAHILMRARQKIPLPPLFVIASGSGVTRIPVSSILYLEIYLGKITVHTTNDIHVYNGRMAAARKTLEPHGFFLCHRSYLINLNYVVRIKSVTREVILSDNTKQTILPVSIDRLQDLLSMRTERDLL